MSAFVGQPAARLSTVATVPAVTGLAFAAGLLLAVGAATKLAAPDSLRLALRGVGLPGGRALVRAASLAELAVAGWALALGARPAWAAVAASYLAFTGFVLLVRRRGGALAGCGCFGGAQTPATRLHAAVTLGYAVTATVAAFGPRAAALTGATAAQVLPVGTAALVVAGLSYVALTALPAVRALSRG